MTFVLNQQNSLLNFFLVLFHFEMIHSINRLRFLFLSTISGFFRIVRNKNACGLALWASSARLADIPNNCLLPNGK